MRYRMKCKKENELLKNVSYSDPLCRLGLPSLVLRRLHLDLIFCYKLVFNLVSVNFSHFF